MRRASRAARPRRSGRRQELRDRSRGRDRPAGRASGDPRRRSGRRSRGPRRRRVPWRGRPANRRSPPSAPRARRALGRSGGRRPGSASPGGRRRRMRRPPRRPATPRWASVRSVGPRSSDVATAIRIPAARRPAKSALRSVTGRARTTGSGACQAASTIRSASSDRHARPDDRLHDRGPEPGHRRRREAPWGRTRPVSTSTPMTSWRRSSSRRPPWATATRSASSRTQPLHMRWKSIRVPSLSKIASSMPASGSPARARDPAVRRSRLRDERVGVDDGHGLQDERALGREGDRDRLLELGKDEGRLVEHIQGHLRRPRRSGSGSGRWIRGS